MLKKSLYFTHKIREFLRNYLVYYKLIKAVNKLNILFNKSDKELRRYYENCELYLPKDSKWRHFRFFLRDGVIKINDQIRDVKTLRKYLLRYLPTAVFYSTSAWLNPRKIGSLSPNLTNNLFLYNDLVFDIDNINLEDARKDAINLIEIMTKLGYNLESIRFTGAKGFHVFFKDKTKINIKDPIKRELYYKEKRKELLNYLLKNNINLDSSVTLNTRSIIRLPCTVNCKTGYVCTEINHDELKKPIDEILENVKRIKIVPKSMIGGDAEAKFIRNLRLTIDKYQNQIYDYDAYFISNKVLGLKDRYVVFLRYKNEIFPKVVEDIKNLQKKFNLNDAYLFKTESKDEYFALCLKTVQKNKLIKILKNSLAINKNNFNDQFLRISSKYYDESKIAKPPIYIKTINSDSNDSHISNAHLKFLIDKGMKVYRYKNLHGNTELLTYFDKIKNGRISEKRKVIYNKLYLQ